MKAPDPSAEDQIVPADGSDRGVRYRRLAVAVAFCGGFMVMLDTTILGVALPRVGADLDALDDVEWAVTAYLLAVAAVQPATGWLADRFGRKMVFTWSLVVFTAGSAFIAMSPSFGWLVAFRGLQGIGGASVMPMGFAIVFDAYPPDRRGAALGFLGIAGMSAPAFGPLIGGWIASNVAWQWLFLVNVPIGVIAVVASARLLRQTGYRERRRLDWQGWVLSAVALTMLLLALDEAGRAGWVSGRVGVLLAAGLVVLIGFARRQMRIEHALISFEMFRVGVFRITLVIVWLITFSMFARIIFLSLELQEIRGMSPFEVGLLMSPAAIGSAAMMPVGGRLADRVSVRLPVMVGLVLVGSSTFFMGMLSIDTSLVLITILIVLHGAGTGLSMMPNSVTGLNSVSNQLVSQASAVRALNRNVAGALGVALLASIIISRVGGLGVVDDIVASQDAYNLAMMFAAAGVAVAFVLATRLPGRAGTRAMQEARRRELVGAEGAVSSRRGAVGGT